MKNKFKTLCAALLLLPTLCLADIFNFVAVPGGGMPTQVNAGQVISNLHYQINTTDNFTTKYKFFSTLPAEFQIDSTNTTCDLSGSLASLPAKGSCDIYLKFTAPTTADSYQFSMGYVGSFLPTPFYWTIKTKVVNPTPLSDFYLTVNGLPNGVSVPVELLSDEGDMYQHVIKSGTKQYFDKIKVTRYIIAVPQVITVGADRYAIILQNPYALDYDYFNPPGRPKVDPSAYPLELNYVKLP